MRIAPAAVCLASLAACTPDIAPGAYLCGHDESCPNGLACNEVDNTCVLPSNAQPFACDAANPPGDDTPAQGQQIASLACVSPPVLFEGCLPDGDQADWFQLDTPLACSPGVKVTARITFPVAFEKLELAFQTPDPRVDVPCKGLVPDAGEDQLCIDVPLTVATHYAVGVLRTGEGNCAGRCGFNRYTLSVELATP